LTRFKNFGPEPIKETVAHAHLKLPNKDDKSNTQARETAALVDSQHTVETESVYNLDLGVYHENEMAGQPTLSPALQRRPNFKNKRKPTQNKAFRKSFLGKYFRLHSLGISGVELKTKWSIIVAEWGNIIHVHCTAELRINEVDRGLIQLSRGLTLLNSVL
jgi:hypothetical protein